MDLSIEDYEALRQMLGMDLDQRDPNLWLAATAIKPQRLRIDAAAVDHHQIGRPDVADIAATAFCFHKHVVPGCLAQRVERFVCHLSKKEHIPLKSSAS
ncbi:MULTISPECIES: hypothetical protein [unclassified Mesorhizobium]|uniref:hypothetical protein n=1 Tax=unclassified Mesorhizobium TaxID=325217 RepID=UPI0013E2F832|nr:MULTISPECIES: hypothetical protein [unclassified Mesorhizobium]